MAVTAALVLLVLVVGFIPGVSLRNLGETIQLGTHMGAKLACSTRFVSGFDDAQVAEDIASYSPALKQLSIQYVDNRAIVSLFGLSEARATYREGVGCTLDHDSGKALQEVQVGAVEVVTGSWPKGDLVETIQPEISSRLNEMLLRDNAESLNTRALVIVKDGQIIAESYAEGISYQTPLLGWSMAKSVTAMLIGRLEYEGRAPTPPFFDWQDERSDISLQHLLQMSSGLQWDETYGPGSDSTRMLFFEASASEYASQQPLAFQPGSHFAYSSGTANLLARLVFDEVGATAQGNVDYFYAALAQPLGMTTAVFEPDSDGAFIGSSYLYAGARDWARLGLLMLNGGEINGQRLLSEEWVKRAATPNASENDPRYGYQFWLNGGGTELRWQQLPESAYAMNGNRAQTVMILPNQNMVLVRLGWTAGRYPLEQNFSEILGWF